MMGLEEQRQHLLYVWFKFIDTFDGVRGKMYWKPCTDQKMDQTVYVSFEGVHCAHLWSSRIFPTWWLIRFGRPFLNQFMCDLVLVLVLHCVCHWFYTNQPTLFLGLFEGSNGHTDRLWGRYHHKKGLGCPNWSAEAPKSRCLDTTTLERCVLG